MIEGRRPPSEIFIQQFKAAAAEGAVVELKLRLLADKIPELRPFAHREKLDDVEAKIAEHFKDALTESEAASLALCRQLRNKLLHGNFSVAREKLEQLGSEPRQGHVKKVDISKLTAAAKVEKIGLASTGVPGTFEYVAETSSHSAGGIYGWLLEMGSAGDFEDAVDAFKKAIAVIDRLALLR